MLHQRPSRWLAPVAVLLLTTGLLAACGTSSSNSPSSTTAPSHHGTPAQKALASWAKGVLPDLMRFQTEYHQIETTNPKGGPRFAQACVALAQTTTTLLAGPPAPSPSVDALYRTAIQQLHQGAVECSTQTRDIAQIDRAAADLATGQKTFTSFGSVITAATSNTGS